MQKRSRWAAAFHIVLSTLALGWVGGTCLAVARGDIQFIIQTSPDPVLPDAVEAWSPAASQEEPSEEDLVILPGSKEPVYYYTDPPVQEEDPRPPASEAPQPPADAPKPENPPNSPASPSEPPAPSAPETSSKPAQTGQETPVSPQLADPDPDVAAWTVGSAYDFSQPAPASQTVDSSYFADAAFVGDSRTNGFMLFSGVGCGENLSSTGISVFKLAEKKALTIDGTKYTLLEALALKEYKKVYISLGINELGYTNDKGFYRSYSQAIDTIRTLQPQAVIYIQGLIPVNEEVVLQNSGRDYLTNDHLRVYNDLLRQIAQEKRVVYLDLYADFVDESGALPADASKDGVHLKKAGCQQWLTYLQTHTVAFEDLYPNYIPEDQEVPQ